MNASAPTPTVLIVGSGPAGLFAACELIRHGIKPRIVERRLAPHHEARGTALQPAVLEMIDRAGLIGPFLRAGVHIRQVRLLGPAMREIAATRFAGIGSKYEFQCSLPQWRTEAILREHLESFGVEIEVGTEVKSIEDDPEGVAGDARSPRPIGNRHGGLRAGRWRCPQCHAPLDAGASRG
jgi:2-polyprenyl-6-methoxyphenol hydroxylase-like FAD-dependent oxidoreductase